MSYIGKATLLALAVFSYLGAFAQAEISFETPEHSFGKIPQGEPVSYEFTFTNTGNAPLVLTEVEPSCGCTTPEWPEEPIMPGTKAVIKAIYNAAADGKFDKSIKVVSNASATPIINLQIKGEVYKTSTVENTEQRTEFK